MTPSNHSDEADYVPTLDDIRKSWHIRWNAPGNPEKRALLDADFDRAIAAHDAALVAATKAHPDAVECNNMRFDPLRKIEQLEAELAATKAQQWAATREALAKALCKFDMQGKNRSLDEVVAPGRELWMRYLDQADALLTSTGPLLDAGEVWDAAIKAAREFIEEQGYPITAKRLDGTIPANSTVPYPENPPVNPYRTERP